MALSDEKIDGAQAVSICWSLAASEHFPEKWTPVFRQEMRQNIESGALSGDDPIVNLIGKAL
jgi:hypothetical protein